MFYVFAAQTVLRSARLIGGLVSNVCNGEEIQDNARKLKQVSALNERRLILLPSCNA